MDSAGHVTVLAHKGQRRAKAAVLLLLALVLVQLVRQMASSSRVAPSRHGHLHAAVAGSGPVIDVYMAIVSIGALVLLVGAVRSLRIGFYLDDNGLTTRTSYSTRSWRYDEIDRAYTSDRATRGRPMRYVGFTMKHMERIQIVPSLKLANGVTVVLRGLHTATSDLVGANWVDDAVIEINRRLASHRDERGPVRPRPS